MKKSWECKRKSWESHDKGKRKFKKKKKVMTKSWESHDKVLGKSWEIHDKALESHLIAYSSTTVGGGVYNMNHPC